MVQPEIDYLMTRLGIVESISRLHENYVVGVEPQVRALISEVAGVDLTHMQTVFAPNDPNLSALVSEANDGLKGL